MGTLKVKKLYEDAKLPTRKHSTDAGIDLYAYLEFNFDEIYPHESTVIHTGVCVDIPEGCFGFVTNKSKSQFLIGAGIIDSGYTGEILVRLFNPTNEYLELEHGCAIAQLLIIPCDMSDVEEVDEINKVTDRGATGGIVG